MLAQWRWKDDGGIKWKQVYNIKSVHDYKCFHKKNRIALYGRALPQEDTIQLAKPTCGSDQWSQRFNQAGVCPYLKVNVNTLAPSPVSSPPPTPPQCTAPSIPCGNVRQETVSALLQNLQRYLPSQHAAELETANQIHTRTEHAHAHGRYPGLRDNRCQRSGGRKRGWRKSEQRPNFTHMKKSLKENMLEEGICVLWTKVWTAPLSEWVIFSCMLEKQRNLQMWFKKKKKWRHACLQKNWIGNKWFKGM